MRQGGRQEGHAPHGVLSEGEAEGGDKKALIAVAKKTVAYAWWMLKRDQTYEGLSPW